MFFISLYGSTEVSVISAQCAPPVDDVYDARRISRDSHHFNGVDILKYSQYYIAVRSHKYTRVSMMGRTTQEVR
jgi:hypothetical protein